MAEPIVGTCYFCGMHHASPMCWRIKEIEFHEDGSIKRVVTHSPEGEAHYTPGYVPTQHPKAKP